MTAPVIAVIEDDAAIVQMLDHLLHDAGYRVISYRQGKDAHQFVLRTLPDVLILDWWLEDPFGGELVLSQLERDPVTRFLPVIVCSAHLAGPQAAMLRERGHRIVPKPFAPLDLLDQIQAALSTSYSL